MSNTDQIIREMAKLTLLSGRINEIQEKNLTMYPFVMFEGVSAAKVDYDFSNNAMVEEEKGDAGQAEFKFTRPTMDHFRVSYYLDIDESKAQQNLEKRFQAIEQAVRILFWNSVKVEVFFNEKKVFQSVGAK